ncbi:MAG: hypothetical protein HQM02_10775, partial [Magnetococcales bacterium]|nr:hypothetical protein [Magnetococcales bacterium]
MKNNPLEKFAADLKKPTTSKHKLLTTTIIILIAIIILAVIAGAAWHHHRSQPITKAQIDTLTALVAAIADKTGKHPQTVWAPLKKNLYVTRKDEIVQ